MPQHNSQPATDWLDLVREKVSSLRFDIVQIVVHDSKVTQIKRTEKTRVSHEQKDSPET